MAQLRLGPPTGVDTVDHVTSGVLSSRENKELQRHWREQRTEMLRGVLGALGGNPLGKSLCIIGAGNATDLDLPQILASGIARVDLLDLAGESSDKALAAARRKKRRWKGEGRAIEMDATLMMSDLMERLGTLPQNSTYRGMPIHGPDDFVPLITGLRRGMEEAMATVQVPRELVGAYDAVVSDCILSQLMVVMEKKAEQVLNEIFKQRPENRMDGLPTGTTFLDFIRGEVAERFIANQMQIMREMLAPEGRIFFASDHTTLVHGPQVELERARIRGDFEQMVRRATPDMTVISRRDWTWNRQPHELYRGTGCTYETEKVTGLLLA